MAVKCWKWKDTEMNKDEEVKNLEWELQNSRVYWCKKGFKKVQFHIYFIFGRKRINKEKNKIIKKYLPISLSQTKYNSILIL